MTTLCTCDDMQRTSGIFCEPCQEKLAAELDDVKREVRRERHREAATSLLRRSAHSRI